MWHREREHDKAKITIAIFAMGKGQILTRGVLQFFFGIFL